MTYLPETYYLIDDKTFDIEKAVSVTARTVGQWCSYYDAGVIAPLRKVKKWQEAGQLPDAALGKEALISDLVRRLFEASSTPIFKLFLDTQPVEKRGGTERSPKFDHHDDQCCWQLELTELEFAKLQQAWREHDLPENLFYPEGKSVKFLRKPGVLGKALSAIGLTGESWAVYTPKQWEQEDGDKKNMYAGG